MNPRARDVVFGIPARCKTRRLAAALVIIAFIAPVRAFAGQMIVYETKYYILHTDIDRESQREVAAHIDRMAEEYYERTKEFSGAIRRKFSFFLYSSPQDYWASGAPRQSAGMFDGTQLKAIAGRQLSDRMWQVVQHEGFHQFARSVIGGNLPPWMDEGLAEYFGEAQFCGDSFVSGIVPQWRLERIRKSIRGDRFGPVASMMNLTSDQWNQNLTMSHYDQAWSMVHFLAHADNGRYRQAFVGFMQQLAKGQTPDAAWQASFGPADGFEQRWRDYWLNLPDNPTADLYDESSVLTLTSFFARAWDQKQTFSDFGAFADAAEAGTLKIDDAEWLPPSLLAHAIHEARGLIKAGGDVTIKPAAKGKLPTIIWTMLDHTVIVGSFKTRSRGNIQVSAMIDTSSRVSKPRPATVQE
jgi:Protein of unknown function (DUF1570)